MATATYILISIYACIILYFVIRGALKIKSIDDYAVGNIAFSPVAVGLSLAASMTSAATFIINPGFISLYGISGIISLAIVLPFAAICSLIVLTKQFRKHGNAVKALTMAEWIGSRYKNKLYAFFIAILSLLLITFIVLICVGLTKVLSKALDANELHVLIGLVVFVFGYMMFGGANSMVYTNSIQAIIMIIVAVIMLTSGYDYFKGGLDNFFNQLKQIDPNLVKATNPTSFLFRDNFEIIFCQIVVGIAIVCQPHIITKSLLLNSEKDVNKYLAVGISVQILFFLMVITGLYARLTFPDLQYQGQPLKMDGIISAYVIEKFSLGVGLIVILGLISAGLSTLEGLIQSVSTTISSDIIKPISGGKLTEKNQIWINRIVIVLIGVVTVLMSQQQLINPKLSVGIFAQNGVYAYFSATFVAVLFGIFSKSTNYVVPFTASIVAIIVHFGSYYGGVSSYLKEPVNNPAIAATFAIIASVLVGLGLHFLTKKNVVAIS